MGFCKVQDSRAFVVPIFVGVKLVIVYRYTVYSILYITT